MPRPEPAKRLEPKELTLDFNSNGSIWFKYRDPYDDGYFLTFNALRREWHGHRYLPDRNGEMNTGLWQDAPQEAIRQLRAMLTPKQVALTVQAAISFAIGSS